MTSLRILFVMTLFAFFFGKPVYAQSDDDVIVLRNGDSFTGEIERLVRGEL